MDLNARSGCHSNVTEIEAWIAGIVARPISPRLHSGAHCACVCQFPCAYATSVNIRYAYVYACAYAYVAV